MDLSQFTTDDLKALQAGDLSKVSTAGLQALHAQSVAAKAQADTASWQSTINPTSDMGAGGRVLAGIGQGMSNIGNGIGQLVGKVLPEKGSAVGNAVRNGISYIPGGDGVLALEKSQAEIDAAKREDAPLLATTAGKVGSVAGNVAAALPAAFIPGVNGYAGAAALGGVMGALQPVASDEGDLARLKNTAIGAAAGPVGVGVARGIGGIVQAGKALIQPLTQGGRDQIAGKVLVRFADNPNAISGATSQPTVTGAVPTLAEQTGDAGIARLQDSLATLDPQINNQISGRLADNNAARVASLESLGTDPVKRAAAETARKANAKPLYDAASAQSVEVDPTLADLLARPSVQSATGRAAKLAAEQGRTFGLTTPTNVPASAILDASGQPMAPASVIPAKVSGQTLQDLKMGMDALLKDPTSGIAGQEANAISSTRNALVQAMENKIPQFKAAREGYAADSKPINGMDVGDYIARKATSNTSDLAGNPRMQANALLGMLRDEPTLLQRATGRNDLKSLSDAFTPEQQDLLRSVASETDRAAAVRTAGNGAGSATAQRMASQNIVNALIGPLGTPGGVSEGWMKSLAESVLARNALARPLNFIYSGAEPDIQKTLAKAVLDPDTAKSVLLAAQKASIRLPPNLASRLTQVASGQLAGQESRNALTAP